MSDNTNQWPSMPGAYRPATQAAPDPLRVEHRKSLAPEPMPGQQAVTPPPMPPQPDNAAPPAQLPASQAPAGATVPCPHCGVEVATWESFCEACGGALTPTTTAPAAPEAGTESPIEATQATAPAAKATDEEAVIAPQTHTCTQCGGVVGPDGYCTQCGAKALSPRDHYVETPAPWVAGCCDKGIRHHRNEDAMALAVPEGALSGPDARAVLVVCDGVSSSEDSDVAALAGARRARDLLLTAQPQALGTPESRDAAYAAAFVSAVTAANEAVIAHTRPESTNAASCTFVGALVDGTRIHVANVGDSRAYWLSDEPAASAMLTLDDSIAQARIAMGVSREEAENGYQAHAITKWLGRDSEDTTPRTAVHPVTGPGWLLVCSDGLWNYCTEPVDLAELLRRELARTQATTVVALAERLVAWANEQGGRDNISVALARFGEWPVVPPEPVTAAEPTQPQNPAVPPAADTEPAVTAPVTTTPQPNGATASPRPDTLEEAAQQPAEGN